MQLSKRAQSIKESATMAVSARAKQLKAQGVDVVGFGAGEPDFDTPEHIKQAAKKALDDGETKYALPASGKATLKQAICDKLQRENDLQYQPNEIFISYGGKAALFFAFQALVDQGDQVLVPTPYWVSYPEMVKLAAGQPMIVQTDQANEFKLTPQQLEAAIGPKTKVLILNSPSNPGGFTYTPDQLRALADVLVDKDIMIFSDEIYDRLIYGETKFMSFAVTREEMKDKTVTFNALSKTFSMTGWRIGYAAGPQWLITAMGKIQSQAASAPPGFCQTAATVALEGDQQCVEQMRVEFQARGKGMWERLNRIKGIKCIEPTGAFYCFPDVSFWYGKKLAGKQINGSLDFSAVVLETAHVAVVPGVAFGADDNVRMSFATSMEQIDKGLDRLEKFLAQHG